MMDEADGAFVWFSPKAKAAWEDFGRLINRPDWPESQARVGLVPYSVPLRNGGSFSTYVVSPFANAVDANRRAQIIDYVMRSFASDSLAVHVKKQNTLAFLEAASRLRGQVGVLSGS